MMRIRTLIVDDEQPARELITTLLHQEPGVDIVGECTNGNEAIAAARKLAPDLIFLDVRMPQLDGFGVLAELQKDRLPLIVFVTAYDQHAVRAFEVHAMDYILKPFEYGRLGQAINRVRSYLSRDGDTAYRSRMLELLASLDPKSQPWNRLAIRENGRVVFLKPDEVDWIEAEGNYVRLHCGKDSHLFRETLTETENKLASKRFLRLNRSTLVNLEKVRECQPLFHGDAVIILQNGTRLTLSRVFREKFDRLVEGLG